MAPPQCDRLVACLPVSNALRRRDLGLAAVASLALRLPALLTSRVLDPDEAAIALGARTMQRGGVLYTNMADRKPPLPALLYEWCFRLSGSHDLRLPRLVTALLMVAAAVVLMVEVARTYGATAARWAGALFVLGSLAMAPADAGGANYAHFALPFAAMAIVWARRNESRWIFAGGVALGLAVLGRQSWILAVPALAWSAWRAARVRGVSFAVLGTIAGIAVAALIAPWHEFWFWNVRSSNGFLTASIGVGTALGRFAGALALFVVLHLALVAATGLAARSTLRSESDLWLWFLTGGAATVAGFRFYGHYWLQLLPPMVLLAAPILSRTAGMWRRTAMVTMALASVAALLLLSFPAVTRVRHSTTVLSQRLRACTTDTDRVFLWGSFPELLLAVDRPIAGTLVHSDFVTGRSGGRTAGTDAVAPGAAERMMTDLTNDPPALLIDTSGVPDLGYTAFPMSTLPALGTFATSRYTAERSPDGFVFWWRNDHPSCPALMA